MNEILQKNHDSFIKDIEKYKTDLNCKRCWNNCNIFATLCRINDEVRLYSRFIKSLLDPNEKHYKDDKFLEKLQKLIVSYLMFMKF